MPRSLRILPGFVIWGGMTGLLIAQPAADAGIRVDMIKYADLAKLIASHKSRVVVVDFWADFCLPCKREFPHLVDLHAKYKNAGLVAISVALDSPTDAEKQPDAFDKRKQAVNQSAGCRPQHFRLGELTYLPGEVGPKSPLRVHPQVMKEILVFLGQIIVRQGVSDQR